MYRPPISYDYGIKFKIHIFIFTKYIGNISHPSKDSPIYYYVDIIFG
jgi:hypothetical protein